MNLHKSINSSTLSIKKLGLSKNFAQTRLSNTKTFHHFICILQTSLNFLFPNFVLFLSFFSCITMTYGFSPAKRNVLANIGPSVVLVLLSLLSLACGVLILHLAPLKKESSATNSGNFQLQLGYHADESGWTSICRMFGYLAITCGFLMLVYWSLLLTRSVMKAGDASIAKSKSTLYSDDE